MIILFENSLVLYTSPAGLGGKFTLEGISFIGPKISNFVEEA